MFKKILSLFGLPNQSKLIESKVIIGTVLGCPSEAVCCPYSANYPNCVCCDADFDECFQLRCNNNWLGACGPCMFSHNGCKRFISILKSAKDYEIERFIDCKMNWQG